MQTYATERRVEAIRAMGKGDPMDITEVNQQCERNHCEWREWWSTEDYRYEGIDAIGKSKGKGMNGK